MWTLMIEGLKYLRSTSSLNSVAELEFIVSLVAASIKPHLGGKDAGW